MKKTFLYLFILGIFASCESNQQIIENALFTSIKNDYLTHGIDLENSLDSLENELLEMNILRASDTLMPFQFCNRLESDGQFPVGTNTRLMKELALHFDPYKDISLNKKVKIDSSDLMNIPFYQITEYIKSEGRQQGQMHLGIFCRSLEELSSADCTHAIYRAYFLLMYSKFPLEQEDEILRKLPKRIKVEE